MAISDFLEPAIKDYTNQSTAAYSAPINTGTFTGRQFVAGMDPLQTQAINLAQQGVGSYQPFLSAAQAAQQQGATTVGGLGALTGAQAYQPFMSPYQTQVIDATLSQFDRDQFAGQQDIRDKAVASGNFGGGREGAQLGQYDADSLANRAALQASMLQQGFTRAGNAAQQNFLNQGTLAGLQTGLGSQQLSLSDFQRTNKGQDIQALGNLGALNQSFNQANLLADQQAAQTAAYEPYGRLSQYGGALTGLTGGVMGGQYQQPQQTNPFQAALTGALGVGGLFGQIYGR